MSDGLSGLYASPDQPTSRDSGIVGTTPGWRNWQTHGT